MKIIKCSCGSNSMRVEKRESCDKCQYNYCLNYEDGKCQFDDSACTGKNFDCEHFDSAAYDGQCEMNMSYGSSGCVIFFCSICQKFVDGFSTVEE